MAELTEISEQQINRLEKGERRLNNNNIEKIAKVLGVYPSELFVAEWQKPSTATVDKNILTEAIKASIKFYEKYHKEYNIPADALSEIAITAYQEIIAEGVEPSSNVIYMSMVNKFKERA